MRLIQKEENILVQGVAGFDLAKTLSCGQCFHWQQDAGGAWTGFCGSVPGRVMQKGSTLLFYHADRQTVQNIWLPYFALDEDYAALSAVFSHDPLLKKAMRFSRGIRVLRQPAWDALFSFIISQNNNIKRISGIVKSACGYFGGRGIPSAAIIATAGEDTLRRLGCGFRARYLADAAQKVACGEMDLTKIARLPSERAKEELMKIHGVGPKVADCVLLFGFGRDEVVPMDVWMRRVMEKYYPSGFSPAVAPHAGIAQQFLFYYAKEHPGEFR